MAQCFGRGVFLDRIFVSFETRLVRYITFDNHWNSTVYLSFYFNCIPFKTVHDTWTVWNTAVGKHCTPAVIPGARSCVLYAFIPSSIGKVALAMACLRIMGEVLPYPHFSVDINYRISASI